MTVSTAKDFADLEIRIRPLTAGSYPVEMTLDGEQELEPGALDGALVSRARKGKWETQRGKVLFEHLLSDPKLRSGWDRVRGLDRRLRLRLRIDTGAPELQALPWEAMSTAAADSLTSSAATPFSRYLDSRTAHGEPVRERPIRMLAMIACPSNVEAEYGLRPFDVAQQRATLEEALADVVEERQLELSFVCPPTPARLLEQLRRVRPHVLHVVCHGKLDTETSVLYLEGDNRRVEVLDEMALAESLGRMEQAPSLVFLAACESAGGKTTRGFRGFGPSLVRAGVPAALTMQGEVPIDLARVFAAKFYHQLLSHGLVDLASNEARAQLLDAKHKSVSYPVLFMRLRDGLLFESPPVLAQLDLGTYREHQRATLAERTQGHVPLAVDEVMIRGSRTEKVPDTLSSLPNRVAINRRLALLGAAGAGKSSALELLAQECFEGASPLRGSLPVRLKLGDVLPGREETIEQVVLRLLGRTLYNGRAADNPLSIAAARAFLDNGPELLILIDGLNELPSAQRNGAEPAIADLAQRYERHRWVLTTRPHGFKPSAGWSTFELRALEDVQIEEILRRAVGERVAEQLLKTVLDARSSLLRLPLFLGFVVKLRHDQERLSRSIGSRSGILHAYVEELLQRDTGKSSVGAERLHAALACLAEKLEKQGRSLPRQDARETLTAKLGLDEPAVLQLIEELLQRGFLVDCQGLLRFWHQTLQEYFYAGAFVERWRSDLYEQLSFRGLMNLRRQLAETEDDALSLAVAHLREQELEPVLQLALRSKPRVALAWADDLGIEQRAPRARQAFLERVDRFAAWGRWRSGTPAVRAGALGLSALSVGLEWVLAGVLFLGSRWRRLSLALGRWLPRIDALWCPDPKRLEELLLAIPTLRHDALREQLRVVAAGVENWWLLIEPSVLGAAAVASRLDKFGFDELVGWIDTQPRFSSGAAVCLMGNLQDSRVLAFLEGMIFSRHPRSLEALGALAARSRRFAEDQEASEVLLARTAADKELSFWVRATAWWQLRRLGKAPLRQLLHLEIDARWVT